MSLTCRHGSDCRVRYQPPCGCKSASCHTARRRAGVAFGKTAGAFAFAISGSGQLLPSVLT